MSKKTYTWPLLPSQLQNFLSVRTSFSSGATLVHPKYYPQEFSSLGINQRNSNNDFWGTVITKPNNNLLIFGFVYLDKKEDAPNEDTYVLDFLNKRLEYFPKGKYEEINPLYKGVHKGLKDYLKP